MKSSTMMQLAIDEAWKYQGLTYPNPAVGAAVVGAKGELLAVGAHQIAGGPHAEVLALKSAYQLLSGDKAVAAIDSSSELHNYLIANHNNCFAECTIFVTLEPCAHHGKTPSCATLITELGLKCAVIAHEDPNRDAAGGKTILEDAGIEVYSGQLHEKAADLLLPFRRWQEERFVLFKWAQRLDGTIDGGTISDATSRKLVHTIRDRCDLLVIGGNTVRTDRPTLDARLADGRAPDVLIISREHSFDQAIPLFGVPDRKVMISDTLEVMDGYNNILIEGGPGMFELTKELTDMYLCFVAPKSGGKIPFAKEKIDFKIVHTYQLDKDIVLWLKGK